MSFKVGDEVEILVNTSHSKNSVGDVGIISEVNYNSLEARVSVEGKDNFANWSNFSDLKLAVKTQEAHVSPTGSLRFNSGKMELSHISPEFLMEFGSLMTASAKKYSKYNFAKGQYLSTALDSLDRHLLAFKNSENVDPESSHSHLVHIAANAMILWCTVKYHLEDHPELDDRFKKVLGLK